MKQKGGKLSFLRAAMNNNNSVEKTREQAASAELTRQLRELGEVHAQLGELLNRAYQNRVVAMQLFKPAGRLFTGFEELLAHLGTLLEVFDKTPRLKKVAFLLARGKADFAI